MLQIWERIDMIGEKLCKWRPCSSSIIPFEWNKMALCIIYNTFSSYFPLVQISSASNMHLFTTLIVKMPYLCVGNIIIYVQFIASTEFIYPAVSTQTKVKVLNTDSKTGGQFRSLVIYFFVFLFKCIQNCIQSEKKYQNGVLFLVGTDRFNGLTNLYYAENIPMSSELFYG